MDKENRGLYMQNVMSDGAVSVETYLFKKDILSKGWNYTKENWE